MECHPAVVCDPHEEQRAEVKDCSGCGCFFHMLLKPVCLNQMWLHLGGKKPALQLYTLYYQEALLEVGGDSTDKAQELSLEPDETMVSFDIVSLFTCVPTTEAVETVRKP